MRHALLRSLALAGALTVTGCTGQTAHAYEPYPYERYEYERPIVDESQAVEDEVDERMFENELAPDGRWVDNQEYGRCWIPAAVTPGWRPYTVGYWSYTDFGWTWVSYERWGWATYHYGRWVLLPHHGWAWIPGRVWAPAWVSWRYGDGYCGWAPLAPRPRWHHYGVARVEVLPATSYVFVADREICSPRIREHIVPVERNTTIIHRTTNITNVTIVNKQVVNRGVPVERIERATGRHVERAQIRTVNRPSEIREAAQVREARPERGNERAREVSVYRPVRPTREVDRANVQAKTEVKKTEQRPVAPRVVEERKTERPVAPRIDERKVERRPVEARPVEPRKIEPRAAAPKRIEPDRATARQPVTKTTPTPKRVEEKKVDRSAVASAARSARPADRSEVKAREVESRPVRPVRPEAGKDDGQKDQREAGRDAGRGRGR